MSNQDDLTEQLGRELARPGRRRCRATRSASATSRRPRGQIRRRRQVAAGAVVAAAAAIIVPSVMVAGNLLGGDAGPAPGAGPERDPDPGAGSGGRADRARRRRAPGRGPAAGSTSTAGRSSTAPGNEIQLSADYNYVARVGDEFLAVRQGDPGTFVDVLDAEGTVIDTSQTTAEAVSSADRHRRRVDHADGDILSRFEGRTVRLGSPAARPRPWSPRQRTCTEVEGGCVVYFNHRTRTRRRQLASSHGIVDIVGGGFQNVRAVSERGLIAGAGHRAGPGPCRPGVQRGLRRGAGQRGCSRPVTTSSSTPAPGSPRTSRGSWPTRRTPTAPVRGPSWCSTPGRATPWREIEVSGADLPAPSRSWTPPGRTAAPCWSRRRA